MSEATIGSSAVTADSSESARSRLREHVGGWLALYRRDIVGAALAVVGSLLAVAWSMQLWNAHLHVPFVYGSDELQLQMVVQSVIHGGWIWHIHGPGAPFGEELYDFPLGTDSVHFLIFKLIGFVVHTSARSLNVFFLLTFVTDSLSSYFVLRWMGASVPASVVCSILFADSPYHLFRGEVHMLLSSYATVPIGVYLVLSVLDGRWPLIDSWRASLASSRGRWRILWLAVLCILMGSMGVYYGLFTVMLLLAAALATVVSKRTWRAAVPGVVISVAIFGVLFANDLPAALYRQDHGTDVAAADRTPAESELYALKLTDMVLPAPGHRIHALSAMRQKYESQTPIPSESAQQTLGLVATIGFAWLILFGLLTIVGVTRDRPSLERHRQLSYLTFVAFLIGTFAGLSALIGYYISAQIRAYDRISIVIAFLSIAAVALCLDALGRRLGRRLRDRRRARLWGAAGLVALLVVGIIDQSSRQVIPQYKATLAEWNNDATFVDQIQDIVPDHSEIFELPYVAFPETPPVNLMQDYDEGRGDVHSTRLTWSYGAMKGRSQSWGAAAANLPLPTLMDAVAAAGFKGVWIDRSAYTDDGASVIGQLQALLKTKPLQSEDGSLVFFNLQPSARRLAAHTPTAELLALKRSLLYPATVTLDPAGFYGDENGSYWTRSDARAQLTNNTSEPMRMEFSADISTLGRGPYRLTINTPGVRRRAQISRRAHIVHFYFSLPPGAHEVTLDSDAPIVPVSGDSRQLAVRYENFVLDNAGYAPFIRPGPPAGG